MAKKKSKEISLDDLEKELEEEDTSGDFEQDFGEPEEVEEIEELEELEEPVEIGKKSLVKEKIEEIEEFEIEPATEREEIDEIFVK